MISPFPARTFRTNRTHQMRKLTPPPFPSSINQSKFKIQANARVHRIGKETKMASFRDPSLGDALFLLDLVSSLAPGVVNPEIVTPGEWNRRSFVPLFFRLLLLLDFFRLCLVH